VEPAAARAWLAGDNHDPDLLDAAVDVSPLCFIARMHGRVEWRFIVLAVDTLKPSGLLFATIQPGILRMVQHAGGDFAWQNPSSKWWRCLLTGPALEKLIEQARRIV
jgi:hypothetical protein